MQWTDEQIQAIVEGLATALTASIITVPDNIAGVEMCIADLNRSLHMYLNILIAKRVQEKMEGK